MARGGKKQKRRGGAGQGRASAEDFLARNAQRPEVQVTDSGLQIEVITAGDGELVSPHAQVTVDQRVLLIDGKVIGVLLYLLLWLYNQR